MDFCLEALDDIEKSLSGKSTSEIVYRQVEHVRSIYSILFKFRTRRECKGIWSFSGIIIFRILVFVVLKMSTFKLSFYMGKALIWH